MKHVGGTYTGSRQDVGVVFVNARGMFWDVGGVQVGCRRDVRGCRRGAQNCRRDVGNQHPSPGTCNPSPAIFHPSHGMSYGMEREMAPSQPHLGSIGVSNRTNQWPMPSQ